MLVMDKGGESEWDARPPVSLPLLYIERKVMLHDMSKTLSQKMTPRDLARRNQQNKEQD